MADGSFTYATPRQHIKLRPFFLCQGLSPVLHHITKIRILMASNALNAVSFLPMDRSRTGVNPEVSFLEDEVRR